MSAETISAPCLPYKFYLTPSPVLAGSGDSVAICMHPALISCQLVLRMLALPGQAVPRGLDPGLP